jgi:hypothetical protein
MGENGTPHRDAWIGVDLDKTLAFDDGWRGPGHVGAPIGPMVFRLRQLIADGWTVKIFTARVWHDGTPERIALANEGRRAIEEWCERHIGTRLEVTNVKDTKMAALYDDRAIQVEPNTGRLIGRATHSLDGLELGA